MRHGAPLLVLVTATALLGAYGHSWSWTLGPLAALALWTLERKAREPASPAPARAYLRRRAPAPVD
ncbi:MAG TPA: hypothetical protein VFA05_08315 [Gaiellaceae bacterium]|nr:hypothetical protein [Gaiellaceae bacterium]